VTYREPACQISTNHAMRGWVIIDGLANFKFKGENIQALLIRWGWREKRLTWDIDQSSLPATVYFMPIRCLFLKRGWLKRRGRWKCGSRKCRSGKYM